MPCVCAFGADHGSVIGKRYPLSFFMVMCNLVVCADGSYYKFLFDEVKGECTRQTYALFLEMTD